VGEVEVSRWEKGGELPPDVGRGGECGKKAPGSGGVEAGVGEKRWGGGRAGKIVSERRRN